jgi:hypothetical protein
VLGIGMEVDPIPGHAAPRVRPRCGRFDERHEASLKRNGDLAPDRHDRRYSANLLEFPNHFIELGCFLADPYL